LVACEHEFGQPPATGAYDEIEPFEVAVGDHRFTFYPHGEDRLRALLDHIASAQDSLHAFYFLFDGDEVDRKVRDALIEAAKRGVDTRLYIDDFGSDAGDPFFEPLIAAGGRFKRFSASWTKQYLIRNHQKMAIADGTRVMGGGFNISEEYFAPPQENGWCDLGVKIEGAVAERFTQWCDCIEEWIDCEGSELRKVRDLVRDWETRDGAVQLIMGGPTAVSSDWAVRLNLELMVCVEDAEVAAKMRALIDKLEQSSLPIDSEWEKIHSSPVSRAKSALSSFMLRFVG